MKYLLMDGAGSSIMVKVHLGESQLQKIVNSLMNTQMYNFRGISIAVISITVGLGFKLFPSQSNIIHLDT